LDFDKYYPNKEQQTRFITAYLRRYFDRGMSYQVLYVTLYRECGFRPNG